MHKGDLGMFRCMMQQLLNTIIGINFWYYKKIFDEWDSLEVIM
jgi:hypothetical protein